MFTVLIKIAQKKRAVNIFQELFTDIELDLATEHRHEL